MTALPKFRAWAWEEEGWLAWGAVYCQPSSGPHPDRVRRTSRFTEGTHTRRDIRAGSTFRAALSLDRFVGAACGTRPEDSNSCARAVPHQAPFKTSSAGQFGPGCVCACPCQGASRGCWPTNGATRFTSGLLSRAARLRRPHRAVPRGAPTSVRRGASQPPRRLATHLTGGASARRRVSEFSRSFKPGSQAARADAVLPSRPRDRAGLRGRRDRKRGRERDQGCNKRRRRCQSVKIVSA